MTERPSPAFDVTLADLQKAGRDLLIAAAAAALTVAADQVIIALTDWKDRSLIDASLFALLTGLISLIRRFVTDYTKVAVWSLATCLVFATSGMAVAADPTVKFVNVTPGQSYEFIYHADGTASLKPILTVPVSGTPAPTPNPPTPPTPNPTLAGQVKSLTEQALADGGSSFTASKLAAVYSVVGSQVNTDKLTPAQIGPALKELSDFAVPPTEVAIWKKWRDSVAVLMAGKIDTKAGAVLTLVAVEQGVKAAVDGAAKATGSPAIDWKALFDLLLPILLKLLEKWLNPAM